MVSYIHAKPPTYYLVDHWYKGAGWYFSDETALLVGPYDEKDIAEAALKDYVEWLNE